MESILQSIKKLLGIKEDYTEFDIDIITHINSVFAILNQLGVGPPKGFYIDGADETWRDYLGDDSTNLNNVKSYVYMKVRLLFDPPQNSAHMEAMKQMSAEYEWRLNIAAEGIREEELQNG